MEMVSDLNASVSDNEPLYNVKEYGKNGKHWRKIKIGLAVILTLIAIATFAALISKYYECENHRHILVQKTKHASSLWENQWHFIVSDQPEHVWDVHQTHHHHNNNNESGSSHLCLSRSNHNQHHQQFRLIKMIEDGPPKSAKYLIQNRKNGTLISNLQTLVSDLNGTTEGNSSRYYKPIEIAPVDVLRGFLWTVEPLHHEKHPKLFRIRNEASQQCAGIIAKKGQTGKTYFIVGEYACADNRNQFWRFEPVKTEHKQVKHSIHEH